MEWVKIKYIDKSPEELAKVIQRKTEEINNLTDELQAIEEMYEQSLRTGGK